MLFYLTLQNMKDEGGCCEGGCCNCMSYPEYVIPEEDDYFTSEFTKQNMDMYVTKGIVVPLHWFQDDFFVLCIVYLSFNMQVKDHIGQG